MTLHRATHERSVPSQTPDRRERSGSVILFIGAVLVAGLTCILYLWQQSQIVATKQDLTTLNSTLTALQQREADLIAQEDQLKAVTHVVAQAGKLGMQQGDPHQFIQITVPRQPSIITVAQTRSSTPSTIVLPATNAAITSWWQDAWDGLFSLTR